MFLSQPSCHICALEQTEPSAHLLANACPLQWVILDSSVALVEVRCILTCSRWLCMYYSCCFSTIKWKPHKKQPGGGEGKSTCRQKFCVADPWVLFPCVKHLRLLFLKLGQGRSAGELAAVPCSPVPFCTWLCVCRGGRAPPCPWGLVPQGTGGRLLLPDGTVCAGRAALVLLDLASLLAQRFETYLHIHEVSELPQGAFPLGFNC